MSGHAREGTKHFWWQRVSAVILVPLTVWFCLSLLRLSGSDYDMARGFFAAPLPAALTLLLLGMVFYHFKLGVEIIIGDYVHSAGMKQALSFLNVVFCIVLALGAGLAVLKLAVFG